MPHISAIFRQIHQFTILQPLLYNIHMNINFPKQFVSFANFNIVTASRQMLSGKPSRINILVTIRLVIP